LSFRRRYRSHGDDEDDVRTGTTVLLRVLLVAALVVVAMGAFKDGRVPRMAGLLGSCSAVAAPLGQDGSWEACKAGRLEGRPDLWRRSCTSEGIVGELEVWRCPAPIVSQQGL
jgi:hypothetical protein